MIHQNFRTIVQTGGRKTRFSEEHEKWADTSRMRTEWVSKMVLLYTTYKCRRVCMKWRTCIVRIYQTSGFCFQMLRWLCIQNVHLIRESQLKNLLGSAIARMYTTPSRLTAGLTHTSGVLVAWPGEVSACTTRVGSFRCIMKKKIRFSKFENKLNGAVWNQILHENRQEQTLKILKSLFLSVLKRQTKARVE